MAITKQQIIDTINAMPEDTFDDTDVLLERIMLLEKLEKAEKNIQENKTYTNEEAKQYMATWFQ